MKIIKFALILLVVLSIGNSTQGEEAVQCEVRVIFPSQGSLEGVVSKEISQARTKLLLALYGFNNPRLADELMKLAKRGIRVRVKIDATKSAEKKENRLIETLKAGGVEVRTVAAEGRNHNKFAVVDGSRVITGSYNWTLKPKTTLRIYLFLTARNWRKSMRLNGKLSDNRQGRFMKQY